MEMTKTLEIIVLLFIFDLFEGVRSFRCSYMKFGFCFLVRSSRQRLRNDLEICSCFQLRRDGMA